MPNRLSAFRYFQLARGASSGCWSVVLETAPTEHGFVGWQGLERGSGVEAASGVGRGVGEPGMEIAAAIAAVGRCAGRGSVGPLLS